jgi:DNA-binding MarR family transcriptional regulator
MKQHDSDPADHSSWSVEQFQVEAGDVISALLRGDAAEMARKAAECRDAATELRKAVPLPRDPWSNPAVAYGALLGLAEIAELAARTVVEPKIIRYLLRSSEARRILLGVAAEPGGVVLQARIPAATGIHRANAHPTLDELQRLGLIDRPASDAKTASRRLELTNAGRAAVETLRIWGVAEASEEKPSVEQLLRARASIDVVAERLASSPDIGWEVGKLLVAASRDKRKLLCTAASRGLKKLPPDDTVRFAVAVVKAVKEERGAPIARAAGKLLNRIKGKGATDSLETISKAWTREPWPSECKPMAEVVHRMVDR